MTNNTLIIATLYALCSSTTQLEAAGDSQEFGKLPRILYPKSFRDIVFGDVIPSKPFPQKDFSDLSRDKILEDMGYRPEEHPSQTINDLNRTRY